jgi:membrane protein YdbS with pleckstrin-like domain
MQSDTVYPHSCLMRKFFIVAALAYGIPAIGILIMFVAIMASHGIGLGQRPGSVFFSIFGLCSVVVWVLLAALIPPYFRSISYELTEKEIIVRKGIATKVVKTVPYRTITNIVEARDLIDRYGVDLGSIRVQTAGMSGTSGYEASLDGLDDWERVNSAIRDRLRSFRGAMSPTAAEAETPAGGEAVLADILSELKAIRDAIETKS